MNGLFGLAGGVGFERDCRPGLASRLGARRCGVGL